MDSNGYVGRPPREDGPTETVSARVAGNTAARLSSLAKRRRVTTSELLRQLIVAYIAERQAVGEK